MSDPYFKLIVARQRERKARLDLASAIFRLAEALEQLSKVPKEN